jgi:hypothetical protein
LYPVHAVFYFWRMEKSRFENKSLVYITAAGFTLNLVFGFTGYLLPVLSYPQLLCYQLSDASAIMAAVIAARYTGLRGEHVAASAFILLGITHGLSLASSGLEDFNVEKGITMVLPMIPSLILLSWCSLFPLWLRASAIIPISFFVYVYITVINGGEYYNRPLRIAYLAWMILEILWSFYLWKDWKKQTNPILKKS